MSEFELTVTRTIPAPKKTVFEAWLDPNALMKFMCPAEGVTCPKAEVDAREGGSYLIVMTAGDKELPHSGEYKKITKYDELVFTWVSPMASGDSVVTLTFEDAPDGATKLTLHHRGLPTEESRSNHEGGWTRIVGILSQTVS